MAGTFPEISSLEREFLPIRAKILEIASALDRIQRTSGEETAGPRWEQLQAGINLLFSTEPERAEQVQLLFSRTYEQDWREQMQISAEN